MDFLVKTKASNGPEIRLEWSPSIDWDNTDAASRHTQARSWPLPYSNPTKYLADSTMTELPVSCWILHGGDIKQCRKEIAHWIFFFFSFIPKCSVKILGNN